MRVTKTLVVGGILGTVLGAACSQGPEAPAHKQKPGFWEVTTVNRSPPQTFTVPGAPSVHTPAQSFTVTMKTCIGNAASSAMPVLGIAKSCSMIANHVSGSTTTTDLVCNMGRLRMTMHRVATFQDDTAFTVQTESHGSYAGVPSTNSATVTAKWLSSTCPDGMKPGDAMGEDGKIRYIGPDGKLATRNAAATAH